MRFKSDRQEEDNENADLDDDEFPEIFQRICKATGKNLRLGINDTLLELKGHPYVHILDFNDLCRTRTSIRTFGCWEKL